MNFFFILIISLSVLAFTYNPASAIVYTGNIDFYCPERLFGNYLDFDETRDNIHICPINKFDKTGVPNPTCEEGDDDFDGINDCDDRCPDEPENLNFFEDTDGCPDNPTEPFINNILFQAFGSTVKALPDDFIDNQKILIQWNNGKNIIIQNVMEPPSPFTFTFESLPVEKLGSGLPLSQNNIFYTVQVPEKCGNIVTNNCVQLLRYEMPVLVIASINGTTVSDTADIVIDLTDSEFNPQILLLLLLLLIPLLGVLFRRRKKKKREYHARAGLR